MNIHQVNTILANNTYNVEKSEKKYEMNIDLKLIILTMFTLNVQFKLFLTNYSEYACLLLYTFTVLLFVGMYSFIK